MVYKKLRRISLKELYAWLAAKLERKVKICVVCGGQENVVYKDDSGGLVCSDCYQDLMNG